jgi:lipopolysaccharide biosynthesis glycosyltransferase/tetratricopeptide (TPR) repeat protein
MSGVQQVSVAVFFRDQRVQAALTGPASQQAAGLIEEFFNSFDYKDCSVSQLLALADLATRCANNDVARLALSRVIETGSKLPVAHYKMGRLLLTESRPAEAAAQFQLGLEADDSFPHNYMGAARALHNQGLKPQAAPLAERFAGFGVRPHGSHDVAVLADLADYLFESGQRTRALPIYALMQGFGIEQPRHAVRLAESRIAAEDYAGAFGLLQALTERDGADPWVNRALALCHSHQGEHATAIACALQALQADPANQGFLGTYVRVLGKSGDPAAIRGALAAHGALFTPSDVAELGARMHLIDGNPGDAAKVLGGVTIMAESRLFYLCVETAYAALAAQQFGLAAAMADRLEGAAPDDTTTKILRIDICFRQLHWEQAGAILATIPHQDNERPAVVVKRLEHACFTGDRATAATAAARLEAMARAPGCRHHLAPVLRYHAEQQDWHGVMDRALPWLDRTLNYAQIGYVLFRAAKHTRRQAELLAAIQALPDWVTSPGLLTLRNNLAMDGARTVADMDTLVRDPALAGDAAAQRKLAVRRDVLALASGAAHRQAVFLCTDRNYLCATIVALHSASRAVQAPGTDFYIVADDEVADLARGATRAFTDAGLSVTVVAAADVTGSAARLYPEYGLFTSGHRLSSAAYYRIYFAQLLQQRGVHQRAVYIDSDVLLTGRMDLLLRADLGGAPLAARLETSRPDVRRAIAHHGFAEGRYFNSGVLLIDLAHAHLPVALQAAISAIADEAVTLLYHDQCALNLGFRGQFADLDMRWNFPVTEETRLADIPEGTGLLHFLDRPKPWSAAYGGEAGPLWFDQWRKTAAFIGEQAAVALFAEIQD